MFEWRQCDDARFVNSENRIENEAFFSLGADISPEARVRMQNSSCRGQGELVVEGDEIRGNRPKLPRKIESGLNCH